MKKELSPKNKPNKKKTGLKWQYHEKFKQKYETYLIQNMNKNNLRLKGNYHYENKPVNYYLDQKELEPIKNTNLTPLPQSKYLNEKTKEKNLDEYIAFSNIQKNVVQMRRFEYNVKLVKKKVKEKEIEKEIKKIKEKNISITKENDNNKKERNEISNNNKAINNIKRNSCIQFHHSLFFLDKKRKTMNPLEIRDYILANIDNLKENEIPKEVKNYLKKFESKIIKIQRRYKKHLLNMKKIIKIQANYKAHLYSKLYSDFSFRKNRIQKFIYTIQKVLFLNLYHLKVNPNPIYASNRSIFTKYIYTIENIYKIIYLQREIKYYLSSKKLKVIHPKKKCVYIKPYTINPLNKIRLLQRNIIIFLERLKRRHKTQISQVFYKRFVHTKKIILIQRLARAIHHDLIYPPIPKNNFCENNIFVKSNRKIARKKRNFIDTEIKAFRRKDVNMRIRIKNNLMTKSHKYLEKIIFLQRSIKIYLSREDYDIYDYPKEEEYITKESNVLSKKENLLYLQSEIKYFLYRQKIRVNTIQKKVIEPLKCTKTIRTNTEKIFTRLSKLRILYDKDLIIFIVTIIEVIRKYLGRTCYLSIKQESKTRKKFIGNNDKNSLLKMFASSKFINKDIFKVIEPEYKLELKPKKISNGNSKENSRINSDRNNNKEKRINIKNIFKKKNK